MDATLRAHVRRHISTIPVNGVKRIAFEDIYVKQRRQIQSSLIIFLVDASESMLVENRLQLAKGFALMLLNRINRNQCLLALVAFSGEQAHILLHPTRSIQIIRDQISDIPCDGATPLADGLQKVRQIIITQKRKNPSGIITLVILSDCEANVPLTRMGHIEKELRILARQIHKEDIRTIIINTDRQMQQQRILKLLGKELAASMQTYSFS